MNVIAYQILNLKWGFPAPFALHKKYGDLCSTLFLMTAIIEIYNWSHEFSLMPVFIFAMIYVMYIVFFMSAWQ